jgi:bla regulator protein blaR1
VIKKGEIKEVPPRPPSPKSPLEHMMEMAEKNAIFYFEGKKISSDKALEILKKSKKINIRTRHEGLERPIVELSSKPLELKSN